MNRFEEIEIKNINDENLKIHICEKILRSLPEWFGIEESILEYIEGVKDKKFFSAFFYDKFIGFISLEDHSQFSSEAYVLGIIPEYHGMGIGKKLFEKAEEYLLSMGKKFITVKTLSKRHPDINYMKTRKFYESIGFLPLEELPELWGEENPCVLMG